MRGEEECFGYAPRFAPRGAVGIRLLVQNACQSSREVIVFVQQSLQMTAGAFGCTCILQECLWPYLFWLCCCSNFALSDGMCLCLRSFRSENGKMILTKTPFKGLGLGPLLGKGAYGRVFFGVWESKPVAVKVQNCYANVMFSRRCTTVHCSVGDARNVSSNSNDDMIS